MKNQNTTKIIIIGLLLLILLSSASASTVTRTINPQTSYPNTEITITLTVNITAGETFYLIDEIPAGFTIINAGGGSTQQAGHLKWVVIQNATNTTYTYTLQTPAQPNTYALTGKYMFEGDTTEQEIAGQKQITISDRIFKKNGKIGTIITETNWKIQSKSDITKYIDFTFTKKSDLVYQVDWAWNNQTMKAKLIECGALNGTAQNTCITQITDTEIKGKGNLKNDLKKLNAVPISALTGKTGFTKTTMDFTQNTGTFNIVLTEKKKGERAKFGFESTIIELTDVNAEIIIDPEIETCKDGLCIHNIQINNNTDSNFCFNSLDIYGSFDPKVTNQRMYFYKKYSDENGSWYAWDLLTTQVCVEPHEIGQLKYYYAVPQFSSGKWNFHFWYQGTDYLIDPYYEDHSWTFINTTNYDYDSEIITLDGNAFLVGNYGAGFNARWSLNESSGYVAHDSVGNSDGNLINMEEADWVAGKLGNALQFDGVSETVDCGNVGNFEIDERFSIEFWFKTTTPSTKQIITKLDTSILRGYSVLTTSGYIRFMIYNTPSYYAGIASPEPLNDDVWHHVVVTYGGNEYADTMQMYIDGNHQTTTLLKDALHWGSTISNTESLFFGSQSGISYPYLGLLDEIAIYDYNLTQEDVTARYNGGAGTETPVGNITYSTTNPTTTPKYALTTTDTILQLNNFTETATKPTGTEIKYQITDDNGSTYRWWNGASWATATNSYSQANTASEINTNISSFTVSGTEEIKFRAYLHSDGTATPRLDTIDINYTHDYVNVYPSTPTLIPEPNDTNTNRSFDWLTSTDTEADTIRYHINVGTCNGCKDKLDANTTNTDYNNLDLNSPDTYYWQVKACDNNDTVWGNCSNWATDNFEVQSELPAGTIVITGTVTNATPLTENFTIDPEIWGGIGAINITYDCYDPNGSQDYNKTEIILTGANTSTITPLTTLVGSKYYIEEDISLYIINKGITTITARCYDDTNQSSEAGGNLSYSPNHKMTIDYGANTTQDLLVDLNFTVPISTTYMSFSCDNNHWGIWETYQTPKTNFNLANQPTIGCTAHGTGTYYVYASFSDGLDSYATFDSIEAIGTPTDTNRTAYLSPEDTTTPTALLTLGLPPIEWGVAILIALIAGVAIYFWRKERTYTGYNWGTGR